MPSVLLSDLESDTRTKVEAWLSALRAQGISLRVLATKITREEQNGLYAIGRGFADDREPVTFRKGGESWHQTGRAIDVVPLANATPIDPLFADAEKEARYMANPDRALLIPIWKAVIFEAESAGLVWGGTLERPEWNHFENPGPYSSPIKAWAIERPAVLKYV